MKHALTPPVLPDADLVAAVQVVADREGLAQCLALTQQVLQDLGLADVDAQAVHLAVEEACSNVVGHGYDGLTPGPLGLEFRLPTPLVLEARVRDQAPAFHPDEAPVPDLLADSDDRPIGGLGWFFIKQVMTDVTYTSDANGNCLVLRRSLTAPATRLPATGAR